MTDHEKTKEIIDLGRDAEAWLNHPIYAKIRTLLKAQLMDAFVKSNYNQQSKREEIWADLRALDRIESAFERIIRDARQVTKDS